MANSKTIEIYGDFHGCGFSRAAKAGAEDWFGATPYCSSAYTLVFHEVPLADLRTYKSGGAPTSNVKPMLERIRKASIAQNIHHDLKHTTMPAIFIGPKWVNDGFSGLDGALKELVCTLPTKSTGFNKSNRSNTKTRRSNTKTKRSSTKTRRSRSKRSRSKRSNTKTRRPRSKSRSKINKLRRRTNHFDVD